MYLLGHLGVTLAIGYPLRLPWMIVAFSVLLPDMMDKGLYYLGIGCGRFISHSLVFALALGLLFCLINFRCGLWAFLGSGLHLIEDLPGFIPWFYPLVSYDFPRTQFDPVGGYFNIVNFITDLIGLLLLVYLWRRRYIRLALWGRR